MTNCECGCGSPATGAFLTGHDQRLRTDLERRVGGLLSLRAVVIAAEKYSRGEVSAEAFVDQVRRVFAERTTGHVSGV